MAASTKSRQEREQELLRLAVTKQGRDIIEGIWMEAQGIPPGTVASMSKLVRQDLIPDILNHEYPNV